MARDLVVMSQLMNGLPKKESEICTEVGELRVYRDQLSIVGGALMGDGAMVTLTGLGQAVLDIVGPACQSVQAMNDRAAKTVFWWNIDKDISMNKKIRQMIAQSQPYKREVSARIGVLARISPDGDLEAADRGTQGSLQRWGQH